MTDLSGEDLALAMEFAKAGAAIKPSIIVSALAELTRRRSEEAWRPIAEAPRDGTEIEVQHICRWKWSRQLKTWAHVSFRDGEHFRSLPSPPVSND